jgi:hypothetical protein
MISRGDYLSFAAKSRPARRSRQVKAGERGFV